MDDKKKTEVGDHIKDSEGETWAVCRINTWDKWIDLDLRNIKTGEFGYKREYIT